MKRAGFLSSFLGRSVLFSPGPDRRVRLPLRRSVLPLRHHLRYLYVSHSVSHPPPRRASTAALARAFCKLLIRREDCAASRSRACSSAVIHIGTSPARKTTSSTAA